MAWHGILWHDEVNLYGIISVSMVFVNRLQSLQEFSALYEGMGARMASTAGSLSTAQYNRWPTLAVTGVSVVHIMKKKKR